MKSVVRSFIASILLVTIVGCATNGKEAFQPRLPPPDVMSPVYLRYLEEPDNKVFVVAVDPDGTWAFGYDFGKASVEEAARSAAQKCDAARERHGVHTKGSIFAINDEIVYYNQ